MNSLLKEYQFAVLAIDVVVLTVIDDTLSVLVKMNTREPFKDFWTLPGGLVHESETFEDAVERVLDKKVHLHHMYCEQVQTFGELDRDPRNRVVSVAYLTLLSPDRIAKEHLNDDTKWLPVASLPHLAYDHNKIIKTAVKKLQIQLEYTNIIYNLLPPEFTLGQLQKAYEIILERSIDKRNFRRKLLSLNLIEKLAKKQKGEPNRPAALYRFIQREVKTIEIL